MTDQIGTGADSAPGAVRSNAQQPRVEQQTKKRKAKRRHVAKGARIAAAGLGATTLLGLVGVMGCSKDATSAAAATTSTAGRDQKIVVVVHHADGPDTVVTSIPVSPAPATSAGTPAAATGTPADSGTGSVTMLKARPTVRPATTRSRVPAASTSGSR